MTAARRRLQSPTGTVMWRVMTPAGGDSIHETEQAAANRAALYQGSVYYPLVVELDHNQPEEQSA